MLQPLRWSVLPPVAGAPSLRSLFATITSEMPPEERVREGLKALYPDDNIQFFASGKAALYHLFSARKEAHAENLLIVSGFTCPDIALAATEAGWSVHPAEVLEKTLDIDFDQIPKEVLSRAKMVVLSNLYGMPDEDQHFRGAGLEVVDDACQGALSFRRGQRVGSGLGILSFGRGKALSGLGGGAIIGDGPQGGLSEPSTSSSVGFLKAFGYRVFEHPLLFATLARCPGLGLGETKLKEGFSKGYLARSHLPVVEAKISALERDREIFLTSSRCWSDQLQGLSLIQPVRERGAEAVVLRYPIILPSENHATLVAERLWSYGVNRSYARALNSFFDLQVGKRTQDIARRLITLPVHRFVTDGVREVIVRELKNILQ